MTGESVRVVAASRTDAGVHALGQVVSFRTGSVLPARTFVDGLNHFLPKDIAIKSAFVPADGFHVQRSAIGRIYEYRMIVSQTRSPVAERFAWVVRGLLDVCLMDLASQSLVGEHDFASFTSKTSRSTVRRVRSASVAEVGGTIVFTMEANSFLIHQIRNTVGALVQVGLDKMSVADFRNIMERKIPGLGGPKAPACGLRLVRVNYPRFDEEGTYEDVQH